MVLRHSWDEFAPHMVPVITAKEHDFNLQTNVVMFPEFVANSDRGFPIADGGMWSRGSLLILTSLYSHVSSLLNPEFQNQDWWGENSIV